MQRKRGFVNEYQLYIVFMHFPCLPRYEFFNKQKVALSHQVTQYTNFAQDILNYYRYQYGGG